MDINKLKQLNNDKIIIAKENLFTNNNNNNNNSLTQEVKEVKEVLTKDQVLKEFDFNKVSFKKVRIYANSHITVRLKQKNINNYVEFDIKFYELESYDPIRINCCAINTAWKILKENNLLLPLLKNEYVSLEINNFKFKAVTKKISLYDKKGFFLSYY